MAEQIDIYDANLTHLGVMERVEAHQKGQWHRTFHCWIVNGTDGGAVLFQLRSPQMVNFPNLLDVSAAGHLEAGEQLEQGIREVTEELGIQIGMGSLHELGYRIEVADQSNGQKNREYQAVYLLRYDEPLSGYRPQVEEIWGLVWLSLSDGLALFSGKVDRAKVTGMCYDARAKLWQPVERIVTIRDFLPRIQRYYLTACIMAERLLKGQFPLAIS